MITHVVALVLVAAVGAGEKAEPSAAAALEPAIAQTVERFNKNEERLRDTPRVETIGPPSDPQILRATYRRAGGQHQILKGDPATPSVVTVRIRAMELERRATKVNAGELERDFAKAPWRETPRGYLLDFQLRWTGSAWEQLGEPAAHPTLGVVGRP